MPRVYRSMLDHAGSPLTGRGSNRLGVRVAPDPNADVHPDENGIIQSGHGMSVAPNIASLRSHHIPKRLKDNCNQLYRAQFRNATGNNSLTFWSFGEGAFQAGPLTDYLELVPDQGTPVKHGEIGPITEINISDYEAALTATSNSWVNSEAETQ